MIPCKVAVGDSSATTQFSAIKPHWIRTVRQPCAQVCQPWDAKKFNFQKALQQEVLFQYEAGLPGDSKGVKFIPASPANNSPNLVLINVSPIEYGHVLLVPRVMDGLTQLVDQQSMRLALQFCENSNNPYFRLCYNSLGAYGTINHLHFQVTLYILFLALKLVLGFRASAT